MTASANAIVAFVRGNTTFACAWTANITARIAGRPAKLAW